MLSESQLRQAFAVGRETTVRKRATDVSSGCRHHQTVMWDAVSVRRLKPVGLLISQAFCLNAVTGTVRWWVCPSQWMPENVANVDA